MSERVMVVAPHCDDETFGCGGLLHRYADRERMVVVMAAGDVLYPHLGKVVGATERTEELNDALALLQGKGKPIRFDGIMFPEKESFMDTVPMRSVVEMLDKQIRDFQPTAVFFPYPGHHQDHRKTYEAVLAACRPNPSSSVRLMATYEYPFNPGYNFEQQTGGWMYVDIGDRGLEAKIKALECHETQVCRAENHLLSPESVRRLAMMRGAEMGTYAAERFQVLRWLCPLPVDMDLYQDG